MKIAIVYHYPCLDGYTAYWIARRALEKQGYQDITGYPANYNNDNELIEHLKNEQPDLIYTVDYSFNKENTEKLLNNLTKTKIISIDHHIGRYDDLVSIENKMFEFNFNNEKSGALLTWEYFNPNETPPRQILSVSDRDLWTFKLPHTKEVNACLFSYEYDLKLFDELMDDQKFDDLVKCGESINRKMIKDVKEMVHISNMVEHIDIGNKKAFFVNIPYFYASDMGDYLLNNCRNDEVCVIMWFKKKGTYQISFRSDEKGIDVRKLAQLFGGGGHRNAAGCYLEDINILIEKCKEINLEDLK